MRLAPVVIVGAGAAGIATAIFTRRANPSCPVVLLEGAKRPGAKILVSGGSRCNVTNTVVTEHDFWGGRSTIVRRVLGAFPVEDTVAFFREIGVPLHEEADGKLFPDTNRARDVLDALVREASRVGVTLVTECRVHDVTRAGGAFEISTSRGDDQAGAVVLATGGQSLPKSGSDGAAYAIAQRLGHTIVPTTPALVGLNLRTPGTLSGVSHDVELSVWIDGSIGIRLTGALLWTHFGASGPVAMNASRHWHRAVLEGRTAAVTANFCPGLSFDDVDARWTALAAQRPKATLKGTLATIVPASVADTLLAALETDAACELAHLPRDTRRAFSRALVEWPLPVVGTRGYQYAEATAGGVSLTEIDPKTMESRVCPGLYLVGEILDVDGRIGGFNFQWAWSSARVAARSISLNPEP